VTRFFDAQQFMEAGEVADLFRVDVQARMASLRSWLAAYPATGYAQADGDGDGAR
jgi:hypothetical protein